MDAKVTEGTPTAPCVWDRDEGERVLLRNTVALQRHSPNKDGSSVASWTYKQWPYGEMHTPKLMEHALDFRRIHLMSLLYPDQEKAPQPGSVTYFTLAQFALPDHDEKRAVFPTLPPHKIYDPHWLDVTERGCVDALITRGLKCRGTVRVKRPSVYRMIIMPDGHSRHHKKPCKVTAHMRSLTGNAAHTEAIVYISTEGVSLVNTEEACGTCVTLTGGAVQFEVRGNIELKLTIAGEGSCNILCYTRDDAQLTEFSFGSDLRMDQGSQWIWCRRQDALRFGQWRKKDAKALQNQCIMRGINESGSFLRNCLGPGDGDDAPAIEHLYIGSGGRLYYHEIQLSLRSFPPYERVHAFLMSASYMDYHPLFVLEFHNEAPRHVVRGPASTYFSALWCSERGIDASSAEVNNMSIHDLHDRLDAKYGREKLSVYDYMDDRNEEWRMPEAPIKIRVDSSKLPFLRRKIPQEERPSDEVGKKRPHAEVEGPVEMPCEKRICIDSAGKQLESFINALVTTREAFVQSKLLPKSQVTALDENTGEHLFETIQFDQCPSPPLNGYDDNREHHALMDSHSSEEHADLDDMFC